jgi:hypothetical protein
MVSTSVLLVQFRRTGMREPDESELLKWLKFVCKRVLEFIFLAAWFLMAWALNEYLVKRLSLDGAPKLMLYILEFIFDISTLYELLKLLFWPRRKNNRYYQWWR